MNAHEARHRLETTRGVLDPTDLAAEAIIMYLELGTEVQALEDARSYAKEVLTEALVALGKDKIDTGFGIAYVGKPSIRIGYDSKELDRMRAAFPAFAPYLDMARTEKEVAGTLTIRTKGGPRD